MNYRLLLWKYITHVGNMEGVTFINRYQHEMLSKGITPEEILELLKLDDMEEYDENKS